MAVYAINAAAVDRYATGFVVRYCPVCDDGRLEIEERPYRVLGIPRVRRTVRCATCRSMLREVGRRRWRYTVDPHENQHLFEDYNGRVISEEELKSLLPPGTGLSYTQPLYLDDDDFDH